MHKLILSKSGWLFFTTTLLYSVCISQSTKPFNLAAYQSELNKRAIEIIKAPSLESRRLADSAFTKQLVILLSQPYSFRFSLDSISTIAQVEAPDARFKIFTWQLKVNENLYKQRGAIQLNTTDGSLKLFPLFDLSSEIMHPELFIGSSNRWLGCIYYKILTTALNNDTVYTLLGYDENNAHSTKKYIDILRFDKQNGYQPIFGGAFFYKKNVPWKGIYRFVLEYKKDGNARLFYDISKKQIIFDNLISENNKPNSPETFVPSGDYEGFEWNGRGWNYVEFIFPNKPTRQPQPATN